MKLFKSQNKLLAALSKGLFLKGLVLSVLFLSACGGLVGGANKDNGGADFNVTEQSEKIDFSAKVGETAYKAIYMANRTNEVINISKFVIEDNFCQAFSLYSVVNIYGERLVYPDVNLQVTIPAQSKIKVIVRYSPVNCTYGDYESKLQIYYQQGSATFRSESILKPEALGASSGANCSDDPAGYTYLPQEFNGRPADGEYYLEVSAMRAFISPASGYEKFNTLVGTDINEELQKAYVPPRLKITVSDSGSKFILNPISGCDQFDIPTAKEDKFFLGASLALTTKDSLEGSIDSNGNVLLAGLKPTLRAENISNDSLVVDQASHVFQVVLKADLTTLDTAESKNLLDLSGKLKDQNLPDDYIHVSDDNNDAKPLLFGEPIAKGIFRLAGAGSFIKEDFIGSTTADPALFNAVAPGRLFFELHIRFVKRGDKIEEGTNP